MNKKSSIKETKCKKPCKSCPFLRGQEPTEETLGYSHPFVYIGQTRGPFWLPCHKDKGYKGKGSDLSVVSQCRGAAIFRANIDLPRALPKELLSLEKDTENVFASEGEFVHHYSGVSTAKEWEKNLKPYLDDFMHNEMTKRSETKRYYE